jgi:Spy/CpxP family protein refolding chaperone
MDALLVLTPEQQTKLEEARDAWKNDEELKSAKAAFEPLKSDKSPEADAAKGAFYTAQKTARAKYDAVVESVLTSDQKSLIESLNEFARQQWELVKGEETHKARSEKFRQDSLTALPGVLTPAQIQLLGANPPPE